LQRGTAKRPAKDRQRAVEIGVRRWKVGEQLRPLRETLSHAQDTLACFLWGATPEVEVEPHKNLFVWGDR
jgi:hypothetical protein